MKDTKERPIHVGKCYITCPENTKGQHFLDCEFHALDLTERDFSGSAFTDCVFEGVAADRGQWADTEFNYCKICHSSFISATLSRSTFTQCVGTKNDYRYVAFRSAVRIGGREDEASLEGMDITHSTFDQFVLFLAKGSAVGSGEALYTCTDGKPGAVYLYQKGMPLLFSGLGWTSGPGSRMDRVERMPETVQRYYQKFRNIRRSKETAPQTEGEKGQGKREKEVPKPHRVFGVFWDFRPAPRRSIPPCTPPGKGLIYGYPSPDRPRLIQGSTVALSEEDGDTTATRVIQETGEMICKYCDGTGLTLTDALKDAKASWAEKEKLAKLSDDVEAFFPEYRERILPNVFHRFEEARKADDGTLFHTLQVEDAAEDLFQHEAAFLEKLAGRLTHGTAGKTPEAIKTACQAMQEDNAPWNRKEALFDTFLRKADPYLYAPLKKRIEAYQKALDTEEANKGGLLSAYQDAVKTYFRARRELRLAVLHLSIATGKSIDTCFLTLGARERAFFMKEALKDRYKAQNQGKNHPFRAALEELDAYFTPKDYVKRLSSWQIVCGVDIPIVQRLLQSTDTIFYVTKTENGFCTKDNEHLPGTLSVRPIEYDERLRAMDILYPPRHKDTARSLLFPRAIGQEESQNIILRMIQMHSERKDER